MLLLLLLLPPLLQEQLLQSLLLLAQRGLLLLPLLRLRCRCLSELLCSSGRLPLRSDLRLCCRRLWHWRPPPPAT